jgi:hypothetical protein
MEDQDTSTTAVTLEPWSDDFAVALGDERQRVGQFAAEHRRQLAEVEARLSEELSRIAVALEVSQASHEDSATAAEHAARIEVQAERLEQLRKKLAEAQPFLEQALIRARDEQRGLMAELEDRQHKLEQQRTALAEAGAGVRSAQRDLERNQAELHSEREALEAARQRLARRHADLESEFQAVADARQRTAEQRDTIAASLAERRASLLDEIARRRAEGDAALAAERQALADERAAERDAWIARERELSARAEAAETSAADAQRLRDENGALRQELAGLRASHDALGLELSRRQADAAEWAARLRSVEEARETVAADARRAEARARAAEDELATATAESERVRTQLAAEQARVVAAEQLRQQEAALRQQEILARQESDSRLQQADALRQSSEARAMELEAQLLEVRGQLDAARRDLDQAHEQVAQARIEQAESQTLARNTATDPSLADDEALHDLRRRLELALDDLRAERGKNQELQKLAASATKGAPLSSAGGSDWESQKRRLLAALEDEGDPIDAARTQERLRIEQVIRDTDQALAQRNREIDELKKSLGEACDSRDASESASASEVDRDEIVQQERDNLQRLQDEWREKLRHAEIDISVERAKLARERADLEEKLRDYEQQSHDSDSGGQTGKSPAGKPARGRWLTRLGLKDQPEG